MKYVSILCWMSVIVYGIHGAFGEQDTAVEPGNKPASAPGAAPSVLPHIIQVHLIACDCPMSPEPGHLLQKSIQDFAQLGKMCKRIVKNAFSKSMVQGIPVIYHGIYALSDSEGFVTFAKEHPGRTLDMIITPFLFPLMSREEIVNHWAIPEEQSYAHYTCHYIDQDKKHAVWDIQAVTPTYLVPDNAVIVLAKPDEIFVPSGMISVPASPNMIVPPFCVSTRIDHGYGMLKTLKYTRYLKPVKAPEDLVEATERTYALQRRMPRR